MPSCRAPWTRAVALLLALPVLAACGADPAAPGPSAETVLSVGDSAPPPPPPPPEPVAPAAEVGVLLHDGEEPVLAVARELLRQHAPNAGARADSIRAMESLRLFTVPLTAAEAGRLLDDPRVAGSETLPPASITGAVWGVDRLDQRALPLDTTFSPGATGAGVRIYILDTGIRATHQDYAGRVLPGFDAIENRAASGTDCQGHGTAVASNAAGTRYGVASDARVVDVRVLGCSGSGWVSHILTGLDWVIQQKQAAPNVPMVANMSLGAGASATFDAAVARTTAAGVAVVVAAGNANMDACNTSPARAPSALTVGATTITDQRASFSNWGRCVDVFAPGSGILGASAQSDVGAVSLSGTSMASPLVAGVAAAYLEQFPTASAEQVHEAVIASSTRDVLRDVGAGSPNRLAYVGSLGRLPSAGALVADAAATCVRRACTFDGSLSRGGTVTGWAWDLADGVRAATVRAARTFPRDGSYVVRLTVRDAAARTSSWTDTVTVSDRAPTAGFTSACTVATRVCAFAPSGTTDDGRIAKYAWAFGDGSTIASTVTSMRKTYSAYGSYTVRLTVTDDAGQTATTTRTISLTPPPPTVGFTATCSSARTCTFDATTSKALDGIATWRWEFGNTKVGAGVRVTHAYAAAGTYNVRLTVTSRTGLAAQRTLQLVLR